MENLIAEYTNAKQALFDKVYGELLNSEQQRAVFTAKGPLLVLAGAGSGKTTVLVNRIVYILRYGNAYFSEKIPEGLTEEMVLALKDAVNLPVSDIQEILPEFIDETPYPSSVLAITFTNKAANEIKARLSSAFSDKSVTDDIWAGTFHSMCLRILRRWCERLGYLPGFAIYDQDDSKRVIAECMKDLGIDEKRLSVKVVQSLISRAKDRLESYDMLEDSIDPREGDVKKIYKLYSERMAKNNAVDFDDIIMKTVELLRNNEDVRNYYQNKFKYVLIDEYQDTNHAQFVLTSILADKHRNIMVVGDDDQSIYRFRGATIENILNFDRTYPDAKVIKLEENYRSTENILDAANAVIKHNDQRHGKELWSRRGKGELITLRRLADQTEEARYIVDKISKAVKNEGKSYSDFAILYRVNELARSLETVFAKSGIPYRILGGMRFYDRKEIKDMIAYLSVINMPNDTLRLKRIINEPKRKIGAKTVEALEALAESMGISVYEVMRRSGEFTALKNSAETLTAFTSMLDSIRDSGLSVSAMIERVFEDSGYRAMLDAEGFLGEGKRDHLRELISGAREYEKRCADSGSEPSLMGYLEDIALVSDVDKYDESADAVVLMTIHSAKGLEFPTVFLAGMEDGIFPSDKSIGESAEMNEERRLCYVAITRAKDRLYITHTDSRMMYGRTGYNKLSVFVREEIPKSLIHDDSPRREPPRRPASYFDPFMQSRTAAEKQRAFNSRQNTRDMFTGKKATPSSFGIDKISPGTRVMHAIFGEGTIVSAKDLGGDVLYEISFDNVGTKKLMATYAKLKKI
ncbi:MAG: UvrD-helicase domain-containing protein [Clostridia bacterium]|nr:UvrD-helicase domain-containing protein [Clostridia bacterium]